MLTRLQSVFVDPQAPISESEASDSATSERYTALTVEKGAYILNSESLKPAPFLQLEDLESRRRQMAKQVPELHFVPYYFRANRAGKGHMRVGLRRWEARCTVLN